MGKFHWVYILGGHDNYYYVGTSKNLFQRLTNHERGNGSRATQEYEYNKLVGLYKLQKCKSYLTTRESLNFENKITLQMMKLNEDPCKVRGGNWCTHGLEGNSSKLPSSCIQKLRLEPMPVVCHCKIPAVLEDGKYVCSLKNALWITKKAWYSEVSLEIGCPCSFEVPMTHSVPHKEPNYCTLCSVPCSVFQNCGLHVQKTSFISDDEANAILDKLGFP